MSIPVSTALLQVDSNMELGQTQELENLPVGAPVSDEAVSEAQLQAEVDRQLPALTQAEKVKLVTGVGMWECSGVRRLSLSPLRMSDGPHGCRGACIRGEDGSTLAPCESALGATFDPEVVHSAASLIGQEAAARGLHILLGPTLNFHRSPISGRHFECYAEDTHLVSTMGVAWVKGLQEHVAACVKHFVGNDQESDRGTMNSVIDERTLREVYLAPFEAAIKEGGAEAVMCGYNRINGQYCTESDILEKVLRQEWGFKGIVMSDWWGNKSTASALKAGLNLEMPGIEPMCYGGYLQNALRSGQVTEDILDARARPMLRMLLRRRQRGERPELPKVERRKAVLRRAAAASLVLVKNDGDALPLDTGQLRKVALLGPNAADSTLQGGGSSRVRPPFCPTFLESMKAALSNEGVEVFHAPGCLPDEIPQYMRTVDIDGLIGMCACDAAGQPRGSKLQVAFNDFALKVGGILSQTACFRRCAMPLLRRCGFRLSTPEEAEKNALKYARNMRLLKEQGESVPRRRACGSAALFFCIAIAAVVLAFVFMEQLPIGITGGVVGIICLAISVRILFPWRGGGPEARRRKQEDLMLSKAELAAKNADATVLFLGTNGFWELEGVDQVHMSLPGRQNELVSRVSAVSQGPVIVVLNIGSPKELPWLSQVPSVLVAYFGGEEMAPAVCDCLLGRTGPGGRLPSTWPSKKDDSPAHAAEAAATLEGRPKGIGDTLYAEGLHLGYRGYGPGGPALAPPVFPFGFGLSYTKFELGAPQIAVVATCEDTDGPRVSVRVDVVNCGQRPGSEVVQVYVQLGSDPRSLAAFKRTKELPAGGRELVELQLGPRSFRFYDVEAKAWKKVDAASLVHLTVGTSSAGGTTSQLDVGPSADTES